MNRPLRRCACSILLCAAALAGLSRAAEPGVPPEPVTRPAFDRALAALLAAQQSDGSWRSETYALFKPGVALTALNADALARLPAPRGTAVDAALQKALAFLERSTAPDGALGTQGDWREYPTHATALAACAMARAQPENWRTRVQPWVKYLRAAQLTASAATAADDSAPKLNIPPALQGGWGPDGAPRAGLPPAADLLSTRHALEALLLSGAQPDDPAVRAAVAFVERCRVPSRFAEASGYVFLPVVSELNKAGERIAYGSPTAEAAVLWRLLAERQYPGAAEEHRRALAFLAAATAAAPQPGGVPLEAPVWPDPQFRTAMLFNYAAAAREAGAPAPVALPVPRADGLFANPNSRMKEDEPLIATPFALRSFAP